MGAYDTIFSVIGMQVPVVHQKRVIAPQKSKEIGERVDYFGDAPFNSSKSDSTIRIHKPESIDGVSGSYLI